MSYYMKVYFGNGEVARYRNVVAHELREDQAIIYREVGKDIIDVSDVHTILILRDSEEKE